MNKKRIITIVVLLYAVSLIATLQPAPVKAAILIPKTLIQSGTDFQKGKFGLTGLSEGEGLQLLSLGTLGTWQKLPGGLCQPIGYMGTASFKDNIYVIGGLTRVGSVPIATANTCRTKVLSTNGDTSDWVLDQPLPQQLSSVEAVAVPSPTNSNVGIIYAFGGKQNIIGAIGQVDTIYKAIINPDGTLQAWQLLDLHLPTSLEKHTVTAYTNALTNETFIYVIGGIERKPNTLFDLPYPDVWRTKVQNDGTLGSWVNGAANGVPPLPIPNNVYGLTPITSQCLPYVGLSEADSINMDVVTTNGDKRMIGVIGGIFQTQGNRTSCPQGPEASALTFLGEILANGDIVWQTGTNYKLLKPVSNLRAIGVNQKIYAGGGYVHSEQSVDITNLVFSSYIDNNYSLADFGFANYLENQTAIVSTDKRAAHGFEVVNFQNRPLAYMFGGTSSSNFFREDVLMSLVGRDEDRSDVNAQYPLSGIYLSQPFVLRGPSIITEMSWSAQISNTDSIQTDIRIEYRLANTVEQIKTAPWIQIDGDLTSTKDSKNGANVGVVTNPTIGRVFQFRATLSTNSPQNKEATPVLRAPISINYAVDGHPSMHIVSASFPIIQSGVTIEPSMVIRNDKPPTSTRNETVLDANIADPEGQYAGFFIDLYVFPPGVTATTPISDSNGAYPYNSAAYVELDKRGFTAGTQASIDPPLWKQNCGSSMCPPAQWSVIFNKPGTWTVVAVVDSGNNIPEADEVTGEWEGDNVYTFPVQSEVRGGTIHLPVMFKNGSP